MAVITALVCSDMLLSVGKRNPACAGFRLLKIAEREDLLSHVPEFFLQPIMLFDEFYW